MVNDYDKHAAAFVAEAARTCKEFAKSLDGLRRTIQALQKDVKKYKEGPKK